MQASFTRDREHWAYKRHCRRLAAAAAQLAAAHVTVLTETANEALNGLQAEFERVLRTSLEAVGRRDDRLYIKSLQKQLECAHERFRKL